MSNETQSPARQRIETLLDANSFVEIGARVTARSTDFNLSEKSTPCLLYTSSPGDRQQRLMPHGRELYSVRTARVK